MLQLKASSPSSSSSSSLLLLASLLSSSCTQSVVCIKESKDAEIKNEMIEALDIVMETEFFQLTDPIAALLTKYNIAGYVDEEALIPGLSSEVRGQRSGLVPTTQMIRIVYSLNCDRYKICKSK